MLMMKNKRLVYGIFAVCILAIAGVSLFYYLSSGEFTTAWKLPFIKGGEDWQPAVDKTNHSEYIIIKKSLGPVKGEFAHYIPPGSIIYHSNDDITTVYTPEGKAILKAKDSEAAKLPVPGPTDYLPATHVYQVPSGSSGSTEPFRFQTEDRGLISTKEAKMTYKNGKVVLVVIEEKSIKDAIIPLFNPRAWMEKLERLFDGIYGWWRTS